LNPTITLNGMTEWRNVRRSCFKVMKYESIAHSDSRFAGMTQDITGSYNPALYIAAVGAIVAIWSIKNID
jgi:hypothetical protein